MHSTTSKFPTCSMGHTARQQMHLMPLKSSQLSCVQEMLANRCRFARRTQHPASNSLGEKKHIHTWRYASILCGNHAFHSSPKGSLHTSQHQGEDSYHIKEHLAYSNDQINLRRLISASGITESQSLSCHHIRQNITPYRRNPDTTIHNT